VTDSSNSFLDFTDADLKAALRRALKTTVILGLALAVAVGILSGWQTGALLLAGTLVSATGLWEWQRLVAFVNARLDNQKPTGSGRVMTMFFLRLLFAGGVLYGSLRCFHGSIYALVAGLGLAVLALTVEAVRLVRS
jgi:ATP synthase I chain